MRSSHKTDMDTFFSQIDSDPKYALCLLCNKKLEKGVELTATMKTPNLKHHLKTVHPETFSKLEKTSKLTKSFRTLKSARGESLLLNPGTYKKYSKYKLSEKQGSQSSEEELTCRCCEAALQEKTYVVKNEFSYCTSCFEQLFSETCQACDTVISVGEKSHVYQDSHWHQDCFTLDREIKEPGPITHCVSCHEVLGDERAGCGDRAWHPACLACARCQAPLLSAPFSLRGDRPWCLDCLRQVSARPCQACPAPIVPGSGRFICLGGKFWHKACFTCSHCMVNIADQGFNVAGETRACTSCFIQLQQEC